MTAFDSPSSDICVDSNVLNMCDREPDIKLVDVHTMETAIYYLCK